MSSIINKKYKVMLFQGGLGDNGDGFTETINLLHKSYSSRTIVIDNAIDMKNFDVDNDSFYGLDANGYLTKSTSLSASFNKQISDIVSKSKENANKVILVRTALAYSISGLKDGKIVYLPYDSILDQAKKLKYIIQAIKNCDEEIEVILVGHSQGGLVDLEVATQIPNLINKMISISTPYSPVNLAKKLINVNALATIFNTNLYEIIAKTPDLAKKYKQCVDTLGTADYYNDVKERWNKLSNRPSLTVISSVSGHLFKYIPGFSDAYSGVYNPDSIYKYSFDGLVSIYEQTDIENATIVGLTDKSLECYDSKQFMERNCYYQYGIYMTCKKSCCLSSFNLETALLVTGFQALGKLVDSWVDGEKFEFNLEDYSIINDIFNGVKGKPLSDSSNAQYYNVYKSNYSHGNVRYCDETIAYIAGAFF